METQMTEKDETIETEDRDTWSDTRILEELSKEFPINNLKTVNNKFTYIPEPLIRQRLDDVLGLNWSWTITRETETIFKKKAAVVITGRLTLNLPSGAIVIKEAHGGSVLDNGFKAGDSYKSAGSNALKKAAYLAGVGAYLGLEGAEGIDDTTAWDNSGSSQAGAGWANAPAGTAPAQETAGDPQTPQPGTTDTANWANTGK